MNYNKGKLYPQKHRRYQNLIQSGYAYLPKMFTFFPQSELRKRSAKIIKLYQCGWKFVTLTSEIYYINKERERKFKINIVARMQ